MSTPAGWYDDSLGHRRWWDGTAWTEWVDPTGALDAPPHLPVAQPTPTPRASEAAEPSDFGAPAPAPEVRPRMSRGTKVLAFTLSGLVVAAAAIALIAFSTAERWTKIDVAEQPETYHSEEYSTGSFIVEDSGGNPCYVDQPWWECRNKMVDEYNRECANRLLTTAADALCDTYSAEIDRMESVDEYGSVVASLGGYGYLRSQAETATRRVSNNDFRAAVTHEAVCYLGFLGECR